MNVFFFIRYKSGLVLTLVVVVVAVNFYLNRVAHSALRLVSIGALYLKNSLHLELLK